jgi:hypothetical protein
MLKRYERNQYNPVSTKESYIWIREKMVGTGQHMVRNVVDSLTIILHLVTTLGT